MDLIEFVDFAHSPKNIMIRASYTGRPKEKNLTRAEALRQQYGFDQTLLRLQKSE
ncbi:MAG: hypothetical protein IJV41_04160 [Oscillospiraceae bacterium]|nr:hypothetical protein [Oscillospiraceae bacterium]